MTGDEVKREIKRLRAKRDEAHERWIAAKSEHHLLERRIGEVIRQCPDKSGPRHAGGGGGLGGRLWVVCDTCGEKHFWDPRDPVEVAEWKALPGKVTYHSTGN